MGSSIIHEHYVCPNCRGELTEVDGGLRCHLDDTYWPIDHGIPKFTPFDFSWTPVEASLMEGMVKDATRLGDWRKAVDMAGDAIPPYTKRYICGEDRADWLFLLPIQRDWRVFDIGSGWGSVSIPLSRWVGEIFCGDPTALNARFLHERSRQEGADNLHVFQSNPLDCPEFPFPDASFDLIVLNGVLEWTGGVLTTRPVGELQLNALQALHALLKPGGFLYIGIENRYAYGAILGTPPHNELPFVGLLPRSLANLVTRIVRKCPHRTHIHGWRGYSRLLGSAGFPSPTFYLPRPSYRDLDWIIPGGDHGRGMGIWASQLATANTFTKRVVRWWARHLPICGIWPDYSILCQKELP